MTTIPVVPDDGSEEEPLRDAMEESGLDGLRYLGEPPPRIFKRPSSRERNRPVRQYRPVEEDAEADE